MRLVRVSAVSLILPMMIESSERVFERISMEFVLTISAVAAAGIGSPSGVVAGRAATGRGTAGFTPPGPDASFGWKISTSLS
jgi:hypothetical protein